MMSSLLVQLLGDASNIDREIEDAFAALIETPWRRHAVQGLTNWPAVDVYDVDDAYLLLADLPGVAPEDVQLKGKEREVVFCGVRWSTGFVRQGRRLIAAGRLDEADTFHGRVDQRLRELATAMKEQRAASMEREFAFWEPANNGPRDPRPTLPGYGEANREQG